MTRPASHLTDRLTWNLAIANLIAQIGIVVTGGLVRLTGSGLGCSSWPLCEPGNFTPVFHEEMTIHPIIEFGNRTLTGVLTVIAVWLLWALYKREPVRNRPPILKGLGWAVLGGIGVQAIVGGISVLVELHPAMVGAHMSLSLVLIAISAYLVLRLRQEDVPAQRPRYPWLLWALALVSAVMMVLGTITTGTGPHSGDEEAPYRFALDPVAITRAHSLAVWAFVALLAVIVFLAVRNGEGIMRWRWVIGLTAAQGLVGYAQYFNGLPILLVLLHMLLAAVLTAAITMAIASNWERVPAHSAA